MNRYDGFDERLISIVRLYARRLFQMRILRSMDADDIEQELMLRAINSVKNYNSKLGSFHNFLEAVIQKHANKLLAMNSCLKRGGNFVFEEFAEDERVDHASEIDVDRIIGLADFDKAIAVLSSEQRALCELARRYSMQDISRILNVNRTTLYSRLKVILRTVQNVCRSQNSHRPNRVFNNGGYMKNLSVLETLSAKEISALDVYDLMDLSDQVAKLASHAKELKEKLDDGLSLRFSEAVKNNLRSENKDTGTTRFFDGAFQIIAEVPKKVTWDSEKMEELVKRISNEQRKSFVKVVYSIKERKYSALPHEYRELFKEARTITPGKMKLQITIGDQA